MPSLTILGGGSGGHGGTFAALDFDDVALIEEPLNTLAGDVVYDIALIDGLVWGVRQARQRLVTRH
jgi:hypothetical protein